MLGGGGACAVLVGYTRNGQGCTRPNVGRLRCPGGLHEECLGIYVVLAPQCQDRVGHQPRRSSTGGSRMGLVINQTRIDRGQQDSASAPTPCPPSPCPYR